MYVLNIGDFFLVHHFTLHKKRLPISPLYHSKSTLFVNKFKAKFMIKLQ